MTTKSIAGKARPLVAFALVALLCLSLPATGCGQGEGGVAAGELPVTAEANPLVFAFFAGMNMAGYDTGLDGGMHPVRQAVREALAAGDPAHFEEFKSFMLSGTTASLVSLVVNDIGPPPNFAFSSSRGIAPDIAAALREIWEAGVEVQWEEYAQDHEDYAVELSAPATDALRATLTYFGLEESPVSAVELIPNLLASNGTVARCEAKEGNILYIMVGPEGLPPAGIVREFSAFLIGDEMRQALMDDTLQPFEPVLEEAQKYELVARSYRGLQGFVSECLVRALAVRLVSGSAQDAESLQALLEAEAETGFLLTPAFYEALAGYEASGQAFLDYLPGLLAGIDAEAVLEVAGQ